MEDQEAIVLRCNSSNKDFQNLVNKLDKWLSIIDGEEHEFYHQFNGIEDLNHAIVLYKDGKAQACGAIKPNGKDSMEVKRMYVIEESRGKGLASFLLKNLEDWAIELGYISTILETGRRQKAAIALYEKNAYKVIDNFEPYVGIANSVCFEKTLQTK